jgi:hypothetical protein
MEAVSARRVSELLAGSGELALLDVRGQGVHYRGHPFFACSGPLSHLELVIPTSCRAGPRLSSS